MVDIFQEVEEDLKRERSEELWRKYGKYVIGTAAVIVLGVAGREGLKTYEQTTSIENGTRFANAVELAQAGEDKQEAALEALDAIIADGNAGFVAMGHFQKAAIYLRAGATPSAVNELEAVAANDDIDQVYRDLAVVQIAMNSATQSNAKDLIAQLEPIAVPENAWYYSAREMIALLHVAAGDVAAAKPLLTDIADDGDAPSGMRARASEILKAVGA
ncbi:MAG: tetratricopeptide repeat protein [Thalassospira sp.]|uniref:tetratricopeptide repeat protein n=1 Tax=Thalassospira sp. TaxID=1912094 RepID=UPI0032EAD605